MKEKGFTPAVLIIGVVVVISFIIVGFTLYQQQSTNISTDEKVLYAYIALSRTEPTSEPSRVSRDTSLPIATPTFTTAPRQIPTLTLTPTPVTILKPTLSPFSTPNPSLPAKKGRSEVPVDFSSDRKEFCKDKLTNPDCVESLGISPNSGAITLNNALSSLENIGAEVLNEKNQITKINLSVNKDKKEVEIESNKVKTVTKEEVKIENSQLLIGGKTIKIMPDVAVSNALNKVQISIDNLEIKKIKTELMYVVEGVNHLEIPLINWKLKIKIKMNVNAENGLTEIVSKPWWYSSTFNTPECIIDGVTYKNGAVNPKDNCQICSPFATTDHWINCNFKGTLNHFNGVENFKETFLYNGYSVSGVPGDYNVGKFSKKEIPYKCYLNGESTQWFTLKTSDGGEIKGTFKCINGIWDAKGGLQGQTPPDLEMPELPK